MTSIVRAFHEGGFTMYLVLLLAVFGHLGALLAVLYGRKTKNLARVYGALTLAFGLLTLGAGWLGNMLGRSQVEAAVMGVDPRMKMEIMTVGYAEAAQNLKFGLVAAVLPVLVGLIFVGRSLGEPDPDPALPRR